MVKHIEWKEEGSLYFTANTIDLYYITGQKFSKGRLFLQGKEVYLFVDGRYIEAARLLEGVEVFPAGEEKSKIAPLLEKGNLCLNFQTISHAEFLQLQELFPEAPLVHSEWLEKVRSIKTPHERLLMKKSASLNHDGQKFVRAHLREGMTEKEAFWLFEKFVRERGADSLAFAPIVAFGENTSKPHHRATGRVLRKGDAVTLDTGCTVSEYMSDATRSYFFGEPPEEYQLMEALVKRGVEIALDLCRPGVSLHSVDAAVREFFQEEGVLPFFKHNLGHSLGLEIHEFPYFSPKTDPSVLLAEGMCVTIEPGLYYEGKWGYRHEDTILITSKGYENLYD